MFIKSHKNANKKYEFTPHPLNRPVYCQLFLTQRSKVSILGVQGFLITIRPHRKISEDLQSRPKISEDVPDNSEVLKKMIRLHTSPVSFLPK